MVGVQPNLEAIARLGPDPILTQGYTFEETGDELRRIAPVVVLEYWRDDSYTTTQWQEHFIVRDLREAFVNVSPR